MALVLFMVGLYLLLALHARSLVRVLKERVDIWVEIKDNVGRDQVANLLTDLRKKPFVKEESLSLITREQAAEQMREDLGDDNLLEDLPEMMRDIVRFNVQAEYLESDSLIAFREQLQEHPVVSDLYFDAAITDNVAKNMEKIGWFVLGLGILLIFAAIALIHNTVRLALYANRFLIKNQELVGATWGFIAKPYVRNGTMSGLWSALLAVAVLQGLLYFAKNRMPELREIQDFTGILTVFILLIVIGMLIAGLSSYFTVRRYLGKKLEELY